MKQPVNWSVDPLSWLSHTGYMVAIYCFFSYLLKAPEAGLAVGSTVIFIREAIENKTFEFWKWGNWDSILDFAIPVAVLSAMYTFL